MLDKTTSVSDKANRLDNNDTQPASKFDISPSSILLGVAIAIVVMLLIFVLAIKSRKLVLNKRLTVNEKEKILAGLKEMLAKE